MNNGQGDKQNRRSFVDLTESEKEQIAGFIRTGEKSYRTLMKEYGLKNLSVISKIKKNYVEETTPNETLNYKRKRRPLKESTKQKLQQAAIANRYWQESDLIIGKHIDVLNGIVWGISYLKDITEKQEQRSENVLNFLESIYEAVRDNLKTFTKENEKEKNKLIHNIYLALNKSSQFIAGQNLMVSAIDKLRYYLSFYNDKEVEIRAMKEIKNMLEAFFQGAQELDRENYKKFKEKVIELSGFSRKYFDQYEATYPSEGTGGNIQDAEYKDLEEQQLPE